MKHFTTFFLVHGSVYISRNESYILSYNLTTLSQSTQDFLGFGPKSLASRKTGLSPMSWEPHWPWTNLEGWSPYLLLIP